MGGWRPAVNGLSAAPGTAGATGFLGLGIRSFAAVAVARGGVLAFFAHITGDFELAIPILVPIGGFVLVDPVLVVHFGLLGSLRDEPTRPLLVRQNEPGMPQNTILSELLR